MYKNKKLFISTCIKTRCDHSIVFSDSKKIQYSNAFKFTCKYKKLWTNMIIFQT